MKRKSKSYLLIIRNDPWSPTLLKIFGVALSAAQTFVFCVLFFSVVLWLDQNPRA